MLYLYSIYVYLVDMENLEAIQAISEADKKGVYVFRRRDLVRLFPDDNSHEIDHYVSLLRMRRCVIWKEWGVM